MARIDALRAEVLGYLREVIKVNHLASPSTGKQGRRPPFTSAR
jgi:hypothetical protein